MRIETGLRTIFLASGVLLLTVSTLTAYPSRGGHCAYCHSNSGGNVEVEGYDQIVDDLKTFEVAPGGSTQFTFSVTEAADGRYAVVLDRLDTLNPGIYEPRLYTPDADWSTASGREPDHRYLFWYGQYYAADLTEELATYTFDLEVAPDVLPGSYVLETTVAGGFPSAGMGWHETESFMLRVIPEPNTVALLLLAAAAAGLLRLRYARGSAPG